MFQGFFNSPLFLAVMLFTLIMQYIIVQFGGEWVGCVPLSCMLSLIAAAIAGMASNMKAWLDGCWCLCISLMAGSCADDQWVRCILIGALGVPVGIILRLLPTVSMPQRVTKSPRNRWQKAISQTQKQLSVVERFRRKVS